MKQLTGGQLEVPHFDGKGVVEEYFHKIGVPTTIIRLPFYFENFLSIFKPQKVPQGHAFVLGKMGLHALQSLSCSSLFALCTLQVLSWLTTLVGALGSSSPCVQRLAAKNSSCTSWELGSLGKGCALTGINLSRTGLPMGDTPMDGMAVEDLGPVVLCLLKSPQEYIGRVIGLSAGKLTEAEYAAVLSQQTGKTMEASKVGSVLCCT